MIIQLLKHSFMITGFVFIMMLLVEYINVQTQGNWNERLKNSRWGQYALAAFLGATPGCLGAFSVVALYSHNVVSFGALVAAMIATSGDEAYVMLSMFPLKAVWLTVIIFVIGLVSGYVTDLVFKNRKHLLEDFDHCLEVHAQESCNCFPKGQLLKQIKEITFQRTLLISMLVVFLIGLLYGTFGPQEWNWIRITLLVSAGFALFVVLTVPEHFLEEHLWEHVVKKHLPKIFLWTFGALIFIHLLSTYLDLESWIKANYLTVLIIAVLVGIIPESGPHLVFVTLFFQGSIPFSILLASSIVQDGHGTLPLLAVSRKGFIFLKIINVIVGFTIGLLGILMHW